MTRPVRLAAGRDVEKAAQVRQPQVDGITVASFGSALPWGAGGGIALYAADLLPGDIAKAVKVGGLVAIFYSVYKLVSGKPTDKGLIATIVDSVEELIFGSPKKVLPKYDPYKPMDPNAKPGEPGSLTPEEMWDRENRAFVGPLPEATA